LLDTYDAGPKNDPKFFASFKRVLNTDDTGKDDSGPSAVKGLRRALAGEVNLWHIKEV
jgi:hypothetical protein